jgi:hypothetical protein
MLCSEHRVHVPWQEPNLFSPNLCRDSALLLTRKRSVESFSGASPEKDSEPPRHVRAQEQIPQQNKQFGKSGRINRLAIHVCRRTRTATARRDLILVAYIIWPYPGRYGLGELRPRSVFTLRRAHSFLTEIRYSVKISPVSAYQALESSTSHSAMTLDQ